MAVRMINQQSILLATLCLMLLAVQPKFAFIQVHAFQLESPPPTTTRTRIRSSSPFHQSRRSTLLSLSLKKCSQQYNADIDIETESPCFTQHKTSRRFILKQALFLLSSTKIISTPFIVTAAGNEEQEQQQGDILEKVTPKRKAPKKPYASRDALLPAARVKVAIDTSVALTKELRYLSKTNNNDDKRRQETIISQLQMLLLDSHDYMMTSSSPIPPIVPKRTEQPKLYEQAYQEQIKSLSPTDVPLALLSQAGEKRQFNILQGRQRKLEASNSIRASLNYYTRQLQFDTEFYVLNASVEDRREMIRKDGTLPDIKSVIVSDLDLRDLVRNQILDGWDDCKAELTYQLRNQNRGSGLEDVEELYALLLRTQEQCDKWFAFISEEDVEEALSYLALNE